MARQRRVGMAGVVGLLLVTDLYGQAAPSGPRFELLRFNEQHADAGDVPRCQHLNLELLPDS